jgi:multidrug transporter EmrE-like cation transporter
VGRREEEDGVRLDLDSVVQLVRAAKTPNVTSARASGPIPIEFPLTCPSGVTTTIRILAIIYIAQAATGIVLGIVYAVWTMYPA